MKISPLDKLFSEYIRRRAISRGHGCERCGHWKVSYKDLQCAHMFGRAKKSTRWDPDNAAGLCGGCHMYLDSQAEEKVQWFKKLLGAVAYQHLMIRARTPQKPDENAITLYLKESIKELGDE